MACSKRSSTPTFPGLRQGQVANQEHCPIGGLLGPDKESQSLEYKATLRTHALWRGLQAPRDRGAQDARRFPEQLFGRNAPDQSKRHGERDPPRLRLRVAPQGGQDRPGPIGLHLANICAASFGPAAAANISSQIITVDGHDLARVHVKPWGFSGGRRSDRGQEGPFPEEDRLLHPLEQRDRRTRRFRETEVHGHPLAFLRIFNFSTPSAISGSTGCAVPREADRKAPFARCGRTNLGRRAPRARRGMKCAGMPQPCGGLAFRWAMRASHIGQISLTALDRLTLVEFAEPFCEAGTGSRSQTRQVVL
jgi:hypothetical protein